MMSVDIRLPNINSTTDAGQIAQIRSYLYQFAEQMQWALNTIESGNTTSVDITATKKTGGTAESDDFESNFNLVKSLIMKSAESHSSTHWQDLGLSSNVTAAGTSMGRTPYGCSYRVVDENHVYVAFNCSFEYTVNGGSIIVNSTSIPEKYRPTRNVYAFCATGDRYVSRIYVNTSGNVAIEWVQFLYDTSATESCSGTWIDGYIDYWV